MAYSLERLGLFRFGLMYLLEIPQNNSEPKYSSANSSAEPLKHLVKYLPVLTLTSSAVATMRCSFGNIRNRSWMPIWNAIHSEISATVPGILFPLCPLLEDPLGRNLRDLQGRRPHKSSTFQSEIASRDSPETWSTVEGKSEEHVATISAVAPPDSKTYKITLRFTCRLPVRRHQLCKTLRRTIKGINHFLPPSPNTQTCQLFGHAPQKKQVHKRGETSAVAADMDPMTAGKLGRVSLKNSDQNPSQTHPASPVVYFLQFCTLTCSN